MLSTNLSKLLIVALLVTLMISLFDLPHSTFAQTAYSDTLVDLGGTMSSDLGTPAQTISALELQPASDVKRLFAPAERKVVIVLAPRNEAAFAALAEAVQDPTSSRYRKPVTEAEYLQNYAPDTTIVNNIKSYYTGKGLSLESESSSRLVLTFEGTATQMDLAFNTTSQLRTNATGETGRINVTPLQVPASISKNIKGVLGFDQLHTSQSNSSSAMVDTAPSTSPLSPVSYNTPASLRTTYNFPTSLTGTGTKVGIIFWAAPSLIDVNRWAAANGIQANVAVLPAGTVASTGDDSFRFEANMDVQLVLTAAPATEVRFYVAKNNSYDALAASIQQAVDDNVNAISNSWGGCEKTMSASIINSFHTIFQNAPARGIPVISSSGDNGSFECNSGTTTNVGYSEFPASDPLVTSTGATTLERSSTDAWVTERAWSCTSTGGSNDATCSSPRSSTGGATVNYPRPDFQSALNPDTEIKFTNPASNTRLQPDISMNGDPLSGEIIYYTSSTCNDNCLGGGTSAAAPLLAGIAALAAQQAGGQVGGLNTFLYENFSNGWGFDVVEGYTGVSAHTGWDYTTGNGSIRDVSRFLNAFVNLPQTTFQARMP